LTPDGILQINVGTLSRLAELHRHFRTDFKTAKPDSGADGRMEIFGPAIPARSHRFNGFLSDAGYHAAPTGVHCAHRAAALVYQ
jgi:hypothetical protein